MPSVSSSSHRGPVATVIVKPEAIARDRVRRLDGTQGDFTQEDKLALKRAKARAYYHANKERALAQKKEKYRQNKNLPVVSESGPPPTVPKRPSKIDALVACNRAARFAQAGDLDGAELWIRFAARLLEGKE
jgi:uncharacterized protein YfaQ (DUF2300 family)